MTEEKYPEFAVLIIKNWLAFYIYASQNDDPEFLQTSYEQDAKNLLDKLEVAGYHLVHHEPTH